jgi:preprotein translocase subunit SecB
MSDPAPAIAVPPAADTRQVFLQRLYLKDASLEMPNAPQILGRAQSPQIDVQVGTAVTVVGEDLFQVVLSVTVTAKIEAEVAFLVEAHQAGIFQISGFTNDTEKQAVIAAYCPGVVFPFVRETIANLVQRTGYPPVLLQPINFEALFAEHLARTQAEAAAGGGQTVQ